MSEGSGHELSSILQQFAGPDIQIAERAFEALAPRTRRFLNAYLRDSIAGADDRDDAVQEVLTRIWRSRAGFDPRGDAAWWAFVRVTARNYAIDRSRSQRPTVAWDEASEADLSDDEAAWVDDLVQELVQRQSIQDWADECFLGAPMAAAPLPLSRQVLAVQLLIVDGLSWEEVLAAIHRIGNADRDRQGRKRGGQGPKEIDRQGLDRLASDRGIFLRAVFRALYVENERLARCVLGVDDLNEAQTKAQHGPPEAPLTDRWTCEEGFAILLRLRNGLLTEQVARSRFCTLDSTQIAALNDRIAACFPFRQIMERIWAKGSTMAVGASVQEPGLWQRLCLQYSLCDQIPHRDILDRTLPAAEVVSFHLTAGMLNVWLSNGRLAARLVKMAQSLGGGDHATE